MTSKFARDGAWDVEHVANVEADRGVGRARIVDRLGVAIDSLDMTPSMTAQVVGAAAAPASDVEQPLSGIFRN